MWDENFDKLLYDFNEVIQVKENLPIRKGNILKMLATFQSPVGSLQPITLSLKVYFKKFVKLNWDEYTQDEITSEFKTFMLIVKT